jgi:hypothetical protein
MIGMTPVRVTSVYTVCGDFVILTVEDDCNRAVLESGGYSKYPLAGKHGDNLLGVGVGSEIEIHLGDLLDMMHLPVNHIPDRSSDKISLEARVFQGFDYEL